MINEIKKDTDNNVSLEDFKNSINDIIKDLEEHPEKVNDLTIEEAIEIEKYLNPYSATLYGDEKYTCISFTNLKEKYMQKLLTTALIGFTYQMCKEHVIEEDDLEVKINKDEFTEYKDHQDKENKEYINNLEFKFYTEFKEALLSENKSDYELTEDDELTLRTKVNDAINDLLKPTEFFNNEKFLQRQEELINQQSASEQAVITRFLNKLYKYDPNLHTTSVYDENNNDPERQTVNKDNKFIKTIPSNDTYSRFNYYYEVNYEEIRQAVKYLYNDKPDTEVAINVFDTFDSIEECNDYINKNKDKIITNVLSLTNYKWNLLGPFKKNRERISFYNENTVVLENILKQQEQDAKMGKKLLDERVRKKKVKNVKEYGKDHPNFAKYRKENPNGISTSAKTVEFTDDKVTVTENLEIADTGAMVDSDGVPMDSLEIGITSINLKSNEVKTGKIYTKAKSPEDKS